MTPISFAIFLAFFALSNLCTLMLFIWHITQAINLRTVTIFFFLSFATMVYFDETLFIAPRGAMSHFEALPRLFCFVESAFCAFFFFTRIMIAPREQPEEKAEVKPA